FLQMWRTIFFICYLPDFFFTSSIQAYITLNYRLGDDAILPCDNAPPLDSTCSIVSWFHSRELPWTTEVVHNGNIIEKTAQAARLSLYSNCFLGIKSITLKDSGVYYCRPGDNNALLTTVYLNILTMAHITPVIPKDH
uniref:Ig-like domain-containing protein n=1 Tax=Haplochromis burtoni TaxID=8153 RepID=A0A3Q2UY62_HAPBU